MDLSMELLKEFASITKDTAPKQEKNVYGTVSVVPGSNNERNITVTLDGSDIPMPVDCAIGVEDGDRVIVKIKNHSATIVGNVSSPPDMGKSLAQQAITNAGIAAQAAQEALEAASAADAQAAAAEASANAALVQAGVAEQAAQDAQTSADEADAHATQAQTAANNALTQATNATRSANNALTQLSIVEDVVGTLAWISEHGTYGLTQDTEVVPGKYYFTRQGDSYNVVVNPQGNPSVLGYYELTSIDEAVSRYVSSHLALTNDGLWVTKDNLSYKILLSGDSMRVYDGQGNLVTTFGESITFSSTRPQYIGGEDAYIIFYDSDNDDIPDTINIGGSKVTIGGSKRLSDVLTNLDISTQQTADGAEITVGSHTISLKDGADAAVLRIDSSRGNVFKNNDVSTVLTVAIYIGGDRITNSTALHTRFGSGAYLQWYWQRVGESTFGVISASDPKLSDDGFTLTLTPADVDTKVTFMCELNV